MPVFALKMEFDEKGALVAIRQLRNVADMAGSAQKAVKGVGSGASQVTPALTALGSQGTRAGNEISAAMKSAAKSILALVGAYKAVDAAMNFVQRGVEFNASIESSKIGIASIITSMASLQDSQGRVLDGAEKYAAAQEVAADMMKRIQVLGLETTATTQELVEGVQSVMGPALQAGLNLQQIPDFALNAAQAMQTMGIPLQQMRTELEALLTGNVNKAQDLLAPRLFGDVQGDLGAYIKQLRESGRLYDELMKRLAAYKLAGEDVAQTLTGLMSNLNESLDVVSGQISEGLTQNLKESVRSVQELLISTDQGGTGIGKDFEHIAELLGVIEEGLGSTVLHSIQSLIEAAKSFNAYLSDEDPGIFFDDLATVIKTATVAYGTLLVARKASSAQFTIENGAVQQNIIGLKNYVAELYNSATANRAKALAAEASAKTDLDAAKAALQKFRATQQSAVAITNAKMADLARTALLKQEAALLAAATAAETRYAAAKKASSIATLALNGAAKAGSLLMKGASGLLAMMGGPLGLAMTGAAAALMYFTTRQDDAARATELHERALKSFEAATKEATDETGKLTGKLTDLQKLRLDMAHKDMQTAFASQIQSLEAEFEALKDKIKDVAAAEATLGAMGYGNGGKDIIPQEYIDNLDTLPLLLRKNIISGEEFRERLAKLRNDAIEAGYANSTFVRTLEDMQRQGGVIGKLVEIAEALAKVANASRSATANVTQTENKLSAAAQSFNNFYDALSKARGLAQAGGSKKSPEELIVSKGEAAISGTKTAKEFDISQKRNDAQAYLSELRKQLSATNDEAKRSVISAEIKKVAAAIPQIGEAASSTVNKVENAREKFAAFNREIAQLNGEASKTGNSLAEKLEDIQKTGEAAKVSSGEIEKMQDAYSRAFQENALKDLNRELLEAEGNTKALQEAANAEKLREFIIALGELKNLTENQKGDMISRFEKGLEKQNNYKDLQSALNFYKEYAELSGDFTVSQKLQNQLIEEQSVLLKGLGIPQQYIDDWKELQRLQTSRDGWDGATRGAKKFYAEATDAGRNFESFMTSSLDGITSMWQITEDGLVMDWRNTLLTMANDLSQILIKQFITGPLANGIAGLMGGGTSGWSASSFSPITDIISVIPGVGGFHAGGKIGYDAPTFTRSMPMAAFADAPRLHGGGGWFEPDEYPAILQKGERVLNRKETSLYDSFSGVSSNAGKMRQAMDWSPRQDIERVFAETTRESMRLLEESRRQAKEQRSADASPQINIQVINETGTPATAQVQQSRSANGQMDFVVMLKREVAGDVLGGGYISQAITTRFNIQPYVRGR